jgi:hypothetical protein
MKVKQLRATLLASSRLMTLAEQQQLSQHMKRLSDVLAPADAEDVSAFVERITKLRQS